jgi:hypothetical protein
VSAAPPELWWAEAVISLDAAADHTGKEGYLVVGNSSGQVALAGANVVVLGVIKYGVTSGRADTVQYLGIAGVYTAATINPWVSVTTNSSGQAVAATTGQQAFGKLLEGGASGKIAACLLLPHIAP